MRLHTCKCLFQALLWGEMAVDPHKACNGYKKLVKKNPIKHNRAITKKFHMSESAGTGPRSMLYHTQDEGEGGENT